MSQTGDVSLAMPFFDWLLCVDMRNIQNRLWKKLRFHKPLKYKSGKPPFRCFPLHCMMTVVFIPRQATVIMAFSSVAQVHNLRFRNPSLFAFQLRSTSCTLLEVALSQHIPFKTCPSHSINKFLILARGRIPAMLPHESAAHEQETV
jgi:hypothetical protein